MSIYVIIIVLSLIFSAFFSGMEIAYISSNKLQIEIEKKQEGLLSTLLSRLTAKPSKFIATMLIGNNIALVIYGFFMGDLLLKWFETMLPTKFGVLNYLLSDLNILAQTVISTIIILITAEFLPKVFFQIYANSLLRIFVIPAYIFYGIFTFISDFVMWVSDVILKRFFKTDGDQIQLAFTKVELGNYITEQMESAVADDNMDTEIQIFKNALDFSEVKSREVMVPRTEIIAVELHETIKSLSALFTETGCTKIIVYNGSIDDILGYVHSFDLFKKPKTIKSMMKDVEFIPETMLIKDVLNTLTKKRKSIAVVLDEYGGTSGILTVEDIIEELFGEIEDEHDTVVLIEETLNDHTFKFSARLDVDYLNEIYKINLPENENYETLGGLIVDQTEEIPQQHDIVIIDNFQFTILEVSNTKIDLVELKLLLED